MAPLGAVEPQVGLTYLPGAFLVVIVGGYNRLWGVAAGALAVASVQTGVIHFYNAVWAQIASLALAVMVLQFRRPAPVRAVA